MPQSGDGDLWPTSDDDNSSAGATSELPVPDQQEQSRTSTSAGNGWFDAPQREKSVSAPETTSEGDEPHPGEQKTRPVEIPSPADLTEDVKEPPAEEKPEEPADSTVDQKADDKADQKPDGKPAESTEKPVEKADEKSADKPAAKVTEEKPAPEESAEEPAAEKPAAEKPAEQKRAESKRAEPKPTEQKTQPVETPSPPAEPPANAEKQPADKAEEPKKPDQQRTQPVSWPIAELETKPERAFARPIPERLADKLDGPTKFMRPVKLEPEPDAAEKPHPPESRREAISFVSPVHKAAEESTESTEAGDKPKPDSDTTQQISQDQISQDTGSPTRKDEDKSKTKQDPETPPDSPRQPERTDDPAQLKSRSKAADRPRSTEPEPKDQQETPRQATGRRRSTEQEPESQQESRRQAAATSRAAEQEGKDRSSGQEPEGQSLRQGSGRSRAAEQEGTGLPSGLEPEGPAKQGTGRLRATEQERQEDTIRPLGQEPKSPSQQDTGRQGAGRSRAAEQERKESADRSSGQEPEGQSLWQGTGRSRAAEQEREEGTDPSSGQEPKGLSLWQAAVRSRAAEQEREESASRSLGQEPKAPSQQAASRSRATEQERRRQEATSFLRPPQDRPTQPEPRKDTEAIRQSEAPTNFMRPVKPPSRPDESRSDAPPSFQRPGRPEPTNFLRPPDARPGQQRQEPFSRRPDKSADEPTAFIRAPKPRQTEWPPPEPPRATPQRVGPGSEEPDEPTPAPPRKRGRRPILIAAIALVAVVGIAAGVIFGVPGLSDKLGLTGEEAVAIDPPPGPVSFKPGLGPLNTAAPTPTSAGVESVLQGPIADPALGTITGIVLDPATGNPLYERGGGTAITPASTGKLLTAAAALLVLDHTQQLVTKVVEGDSPGEVIIVGGGDPTLSSLEPGNQSVYKGAAHLAELVDKVKASGVQVQTVYIDQERYVGDNMAPGWLSADVGGGFITPIVPAMVDGGRSDGTVNYSPRTSNPGGQLVDEFANRIGATAPDKAEKKAPANAKVIAEVKSAPLTQLVDNMLDHSDNVLAEILAHEVAIKTGKEPSFAGGSEATLDVLRQNGFDVEGVAWKDGSGLSTEDKVSAKLLAQILAVAAGPDGKDERTAKLRPLLGGLPVAGGSGTLADRYVEAGANDARGWLRAKTGSLTGVNSLAGIVLDKDNRPLVFAFLTGGTSSNTARPALDRVTAALRSCGCQ